MLGFWAWVWVCIVCVKGGAGLRVGAWWFKLGDKVKVETDSSAVEGIGVVMESN